MQFLSNLALVFTSLLPVIVASLLIAGFAGLVNDLIERPRRYRHMAAKSLLAADRLHRTVLVAWPGSVPEWYWSLGQRLDVRYRHWSAHSLGETCMRCEHAEFLANRPAPSVIVKGACQ